MAPLLTERDLYLAYQINSTCSYLANKGSSHTLVACIGMGHMNGVVNALRSPPTKQDVDAILVIPETTSIRTYLLRGAVVTATAVVSIVVLRKLLSRR